MTKTFTHDDILRYAYEETSEEENTLTEQALLADPILLEYYLDTIDLKAGLDRAILSPSDRVVDNILAFSRNYQSQPKRLIF
ncbi:MAG: hypothetical protein LH606_04745 [Cytophagaceae bacterium]|nr:hypothetical protein [Cytophagaceae bacterium]